MSDLIEDLNATAPEAETSDKLRSSELAECDAPPQAPAAAGADRALRARGGRPKTLEEVGTILGITRERVRQLETRALRELRAVAPALELYLRT